MDKAANIKYLISNIQSSIENILKEITKIYFLGNYCGLESR